MNLETAERHKLKHIANSRDLLRTRTREAIKFLNFLKVTDQANAEIVYKQHKKQEVHCPIELELKHMLKANFCLLLYNAIEGVFTQLAEDINDYISDNSVENIDDLRTELFRHILGKFRNSNNFSYDIVHPPLGNSIMQFWIDEWKKTKAKPRENRVKENSGNIDGKTIHEDLLTRYGIVPRDQKKPLKRFSHWALQVNKDRRNYLAHGERSFVDMGRELSIEGLTQEARYIYRTLKNIAQEVDLYLNEKGYLRTSSWQQAFFQSSSNSSA